MDKSKNLFESGNFELHSGKQSKWKIECDTLIEEDYETLAWIVAKEWKLEFAFATFVGAKVTYKGHVANSYEFASALNKYKKSDMKYPILLVDDVLTSGRTIISDMLILKRTYQGCNIIGVVIFARGKCPKCVRPVCQYNG